jgi:hypothetical protein
MEATQSETEKKEQILQKLTDIIVDLHDIEVALDEFFGPAKEVKKPKEKRVTKKKDVPKAEIQLKDCPEYIYEGPKRKHAKKVKIDETENITHNYIFDSTILPDEYQEIVEKNEK